MVPRANRRDTSTPLPSESSYGAIPVDPVKYQVKVDYPRELRHQRVETITVSLAPLQLLDSALNIGPNRSPISIPVRLVVPGAILLPTEQTLTPTPFGHADAVFHVTALAQGNLPDCRVELFRQGKVETIPLPLCSSSHRALAWWIALMFVIPLLLFLPTCWPGLAERGEVERIVASWVPGTPFALGRVAQGVYAFLATTGLRWSLSFFAFLALLSGATLWAVSRRTIIETAANEPFLLMPQTGSNGKISPFPALLTPVPPEEFGSAQL